jgi:hypothetical protein
MEFLGKIPKRTSEGIFERASGLDFKDGRIIKGI